MPFLSEITYDRLQGAPSPSPYVGPARDCAGAKSGRGSSTWLDGCERPATKVRSGRWPVCAVHARTPLLAVTKADALAG